MLYLFDIAIILILAFCAWRGAKKGLILMLCSLIGIFVAFFGARFVSTQFYEPVANVIQPAIHQSILGAGEDGSQKAAFSNSTQDTYSLEELLDILQQSELFTGLSQLLEDAVDNDTIREDAGNTASEALATYLSRVIAKAGLFALTFLVLLLVWFLLGHLLDLAFKLPVLSAVNWIGGLVLGLLKAVLMVMVLIWIFQLAGVISNPPETPIVSMFTAQRVLTLLNGLVA